ncbi:hypothetical protein PG997_010455 [Apiospora hydei]|uniref:Uncharacterized protein n=1 Tax=Apiospora hydei TaxID=1337664 RepID=A0ABR1VX68_9PEZI
MIPSRPSSSSSPSPIAVYKSSPSYKSSSSSPIGKSISPKSSSSSLRSQNRSPLSVKNCNSAKSNNSLKGKSSALRSLPTPPPSRSGSGSGSRLSSHSHYTPGRPRPSKTLSRALENELRVLAFDIGDGHFNGEPTLLIANPDSNCHAVFWAKPDRTEIVFHHGRLKEKADPTSTTETTNDDKHCGCMVKGAPGTSTFDIPPRLDEYRLELILGIGRSGIKMEPKLAAMVVMKLFLGMEVPKALRM